MDVRIQEGCDDTEIVIKCPEATDEIKRIASLLQDSGQKLSGIKDGQTHLIEKSDVFYCESVDKRYYIYTADEVYQTYLKLYELEEHLPGSIFFRSSKSQITNLKKIASLCPDFGGRIEAVMENGERIVVSRQYSKLLKERLGL